MTKEQLAGLLNGHPYGNEMTKDQENAAKADGLVVVFGYSDDNTEFRGAIRDEVGCYGSKDIYIDRDGPLEDHDDCECKYCGYEHKKNNAKRITAIFDEGPYRWETDIPNATFDIWEDGEIYCTGIVFRVEELGPF